MRCPRCKSTNIAVVMYKCNYSAFNGYRRTSSDYSLIRCQELNLSALRPPLRTRAWGRTKS